MIHSNLKKRLKDLQKSAGIEKGKRLRTWVFYSDNDEGKAAEMEKIKAGKVRQKDGGTYSEEDANFFIDVRYCPGGVAPGQDLPAANSSDSTPLNSEAIIPVEENAGIDEPEDPEAALAKEIRELEARIKKLKG